MRKRGAESGVSAPLVDVKAVFRFPTEGPSTLLDTWSITVPAAEEATISVPWKKPPDRLAWELDVAAVNRDHDFALSVRLLEAGAIHYKWAERALELSAHGSQPTKPDHELVSIDELSFSLPETNRKQVPISLWHYQRAMARRQRAERLRNCGRSEYVVTAHCAQGHEHHHDMGCGDYRLCILCRGRQIANFRRDVRNYADELRDRAHAMALDRAIQDRLLTLTAPDHGTTEERLEIRSLAWRLFSKRLGRWWASDAERMAKDRGATVEQVRGAIGFFRVLEVTPGRDELGHFHHHVWMHSPWLTSSDVHDAWRAVVLYVVKRRFPHLLEKYEVDRYQVDLRLADPATFDVELVKYLLKDWSETKLGERIDPSSFGRILRALDGTRMRQGAAGWREIADERREVPLCRSCGSTVVHDIRHVDRFDLHSHDEQGCESGPRKGAFIRPPPLDPLPKVGDQLRIGFDVQGAYDAPKRRRPSAGD